MKISKRDGTRGCLLRSLRDCAGNTCKNTGQRHSFRPPFPCQLYEDRLKAERDEWARTAQAEKDGIEKGKLIGRIETLRSILDLETDDLKPLDDASFDRLTTLAAELQRRLRDRT